MFDRVPGLMGPQRKGLQGGQVLGGVREPDLGSSPRSRAHTAFLISSVFTSAFDFFKKESIYSKDEFLFSAQRLLLCCHLM